MPEVDYEVTWTGATHRQFPTLPAPELRKPLPMEPAQPRQGLEDVLAALSDDWINTRGIARRTGISDRSVWRWLKILTQQGETEMRVAPPTTLRGRPQKLYRRRQTQESA